jgi:hypothetical protein
MAQIKEFVINDRRKFTPEGDLRPDAPHSEPRPIRETPSEPATFPAKAEAEAGPKAASAAAEPTLSDAGEPSAAPAEAAQTDSFEEQLPPPPTAEQSQQAARAYEATADRLDTAIRATNPGMEHMPKMTFGRVVQSLYMQALLQLGAAAEPGQQPQVDILGARQTIDMLSVIGSKTGGSLSESEQTLLDSALFEIRMAFLEVTQALARQAQSRQPGAPGIPRAPGMPTGPSIVR